MALGRLLAAVPGQRRRWHAELVRVGRDLNGKIRTAEMLRKRASLFEGRPLKVLDLVTADGRRLQDHQQIDGLVGLEVMNVVGHTENVRFDERAFGGVGGLVSDVVLLEGDALADRLASKIEGLAANGGLQKNPIGLSFNGYGRTDRQGREDIELVDSVDFVTNPAAYGRLTHRLAASVRSVSMKDLIGVLTRLCASLAAGLPADIVTDYALGKHIAERIKASADLSATVVTALGLDAAAVAKDPLDPVMGWIAKARGELDAAARLKASEDAAREAAAAAAGAEADAEVKEQRRRAKAAADEIEALATQQRVRAACQEKALPAKVTERLLASVAGQCLSVDEAKRLAASKAAEIDELRAADVGGRIVVVEEKRDRLTAALGRMLSRRCPQPEGMNVERTFMGSLHKFCRDGFGIDLMEAARGDPERRRLRASIDAVNFDTVFAEGLSRAFLAEYVGDPSFTQPWRAIVNVVSERDFREKQVIATTYYDELPIVTEGAAYNPLTTPTDRVEKYKMEKRGGTEDITWEKMLNDDIGLVSRLLQRLALTARETLNERCFVPIRIATQPTMADGKKLTDATRANSINLLTAALSGDATGWGNFILAVNQMISQNGGGGKPKGIKPRHLIIPLALAQNAGRLFADFSPAATDVPSRRGLEILKAQIPNVIVDLGTGNTTDWFLMADPAEAEVLRVAFLGGREEPEIFIANNETFGTMFTNDKIVMKARHPYVVGVVDYAGIQGNDV